MKAAAPEHDASVGDHGRAASTRRAAGKLLGGKILEQGLITPVGIEAVEVGLMQTWAVNVSIPSGGGG
eukprot:1504162-Alexandrium_andersonii.AAC.1